MAKTAKRWALWLGIFASLVTISMKWTARDSRIQAIETKVYHYEKEFEDNKSDHIELKRMVLDNNKLLIRLIIRTPK